MDRLTLVLIAGMVMLADSTAAGEIFEHTDPDTGTQVFVLRQGSTVARFAPSKGANVFSIEVSGIEYLRTPANMYAFEGNLHGVPILYPTPNRVKDSVFMFDGKKYELEPNFGPHRIHGLVIGQPWHVIGQETTAESAAIHSAIDFLPGSPWYAQFPFRHRLLLTLTVTDSAVRWDYKVDNIKGDQPVPFGFGLHPYFIYQGMRDGTFVTLPATHWMEASEALPSGRLVPAEALDYALTGPLPASRDFDDVYFGMHPDTPAIIDFRDSGRAVELRFSEEFTHAVLWTEGPVLSVENQTSSTDAHNLHAAGFEPAAHLQVCATGQACTGWVEYRFTASGSWQWIWDDPNFLLSREHCESCHGIVFSGARAPDLFTRGFHHAQTREERAALISAGVPGTEMPAFEGILSEAEIDSMAGFMERILVELPEQELRTALDVEHAGARQTFLESFALETVAQGLDMPWSFAFLPDGDILLTEKPGSLRRVHDGVVGERVRDVPRVAFRQDAGLLALALHPDFARNGWIYLAFAEPGVDPNTSAIKLVRGRIRDNTWVDQETIWSSPPSLYRADNSHFGTRLVFDGDYLFFSIGDRGRREEAQDLESPHGKIHRVHADGSVPEDNLFARADAGLGTIWSYGHRNVQGMAFSDAGDLWASEHGPRGGDELNRVVAGMNYGWPLATWGREFNGEPISEHTRLPGMADPTMVWHEGIAPSAVAFYRGDRFPAWRNSLLVASLAAKELRRVEIVGSEARSQELLLKGIGRIRDVQVSPEGYPYLAVERPGGSGVLLRLVPATRIETPLF